MSTLHLNIETVDLTTASAAGVNDDENRETMTSSSPAIIDSDYDEFLALPDSVRVIDISGEPVVVQSRERHDVDSGGTCTANKIIPFKSIHNAPVKFSSYHRNCYIPNVDITVTIIDNERSVTTHLLNPNLYSIKVQHGEYWWIIKKRYKHIQELHQYLRLFRASLNIPFPTKTHKERRTSFKNNAERKGALPRFPAKPDALVPFESLSTRIKNLEDYLNNLLNIDVYKNHEQTLAFFEISKLSFVHDLGEKGKEGFVRKRTGSTQPGQAGCNCFGFLYSTMCVRCNYFWNDVLCGTWRNRWFFVKDTCFGYVRPKDGHIRCVILFDQGFEVSSGMYSTGMHHGLQIMTMSRQIAIKCWTRRRTKEWMQHLKNTANHQARDFTQPNEHNSFAPSRMNTQTCWFVDGASYMSAVADALEAAAEEIFIADWWLSPEIYMKRPALDGEYWRLDKILERKAKLGVNIFVLLYKEVEMALGINSFYSKERLTDNHPENIKVLRHPDHAKAGVFLWAHHEKIVVVDQSYAFLGGIDLCYGRWDDAKHRLTDLGSLCLPLQTGTTKKKTSSTPTDTSLYPAIVLPIHPPPHSCVNETNSNMEHMKCNTPESERKTNMFIDRVQRKSKDFIHLIYSQHEQLTNGDECQKLNEQQLDGSAKLWIGKDYTNFIVKDFTNLDLPYADLVDRTCTPRMPWHDIGVLVEGAAARDVSRHFIQRWNATKLEKARLNVSYPYLLPKSYTNCSSSSSSKMQQQLNVTCQVVRSVSSWSCGFLDPDTVESSIHEAYVDCINRAQHYIYIENQFFITLQNSGGGSVVRNQIGDALFRRIKRAHKEKSVFRVYVILPLLPGFEGEVGGPTGTALHAITHWNYASISNGKLSLLTRLKEEAGIEDPTEYITFYGLRTHSILNGEPITELIYVHSKLMIVDDRTVICGSANINDRSLLGKRDSEIAVIIQDEAFDDGTMNGNAFPSGKFAGSLRRHLFREHLLGVEQQQQQTIDVTDPVIDAFYKGVWHQTAELNTELYEKVFHCIPSDKVNNFSALRKYQEEPPLYHTEVSRASKMLQDIQGHLVLLPLKFLCNEILTPSGNSVEGMMPTSLWT